MPDLAILLVPYYQTFSRSQVRPYCLNYTNSSGELASTRFIHGADGRVTKSLYQLITGQLSAVNTHEFDVNGHMVRKLRKFSDGATSEEIFQYDPRGRLISESFSNSMGTTGTADYIYRDDGNAARMLCAGYKGWFFGEIVFEFDRSGKRTSGKILQDGKPDGSITYKYENGSNLVLELWETGDNWSQTLNYVYESVD